MSPNGNPTGSTAPLRATEEADAGVNVKLIVSVGVVALVLFAVSTWAAYLMLVKQEADLKAAHGERDPRALLGQPEIGIVDTAHFDDDGRLAAWKAEMKARVAGYTWVDKAKGVVAIPVEQAMQQVIEQNHHESREMKPLPWPTAPAAPGTLEIAIRNLKAGQAVSAPAPASAVPAAAKPKAKPAGVLQPAGAPAEGGQQ